MQELRRKLTQLKMVKEKPKMSFFESICSLPFNRNNCMVQFFRDIELPKYDKHDGNGDPHDHV